MMVALKPKLISLTVITLIASGFLAACKKTAVLPTERNSDNIWYFDGDKHIVTASNRTGSPGASQTDIVFQDSYLSDVATLDLSFKDIPESSGTYKLIRHKLEPLGNKEMNLNSSSTKTGSCTYIGEAIDIQVTVTNGKLKVAVPEIDMKSFDPAKPIYKLSAAIYEL